MQTNINEARIKKLRWNYFDVTNNFLGREINYLKKKVFQDNFLF